MRSMRAAAVALAGGATLLALTAAPSSAAAPTVDPGAATKAVNCGTGWNGLSVVAVTTKGSSACGTAHRVANAYGDAVQAKHHGGTGRKVVVVHVDDARWKCRERQGDPNPYTECVNLKDRAEKVQLVS
ncbi:hypothetical protein AB0A69_19235 [Streptomyces sp. NPDC045431]|uniref:hypothetical protein n=1 Tax=Streptomyces sp. NPDC045431 TaxID=3155613 RepID=UPI0033FA04D3